MNLQIILLALIGSYGTYLIAHTYKISAIRTSCLLTIICFILLYTFNAPNKELLHAVFFGGSFTGMSDRLRLGYKRLFLATLLYAIVLIFILPFFKGTGGGLGAAAFVSSTFTYIINSIKNKTVDIIQSKKQKA